MVHGHHRPAPCRQPPTSGAESHRHASMPHETPRARTRSDERAALSPRARPASWTATPSTNVATTRASPISPAARSNRSRSSTTRSADLPTSIEPTSASRWLTHAEPSVNAARASSSPIRSSGRNGGFSPAMHVADPVDRDLDLEQWDRRWTRSSPSPSPAAPRHAAASRTDRPGRRAPARGRGGSGARADPRGRPSRPGRWPPRRAPGSARRRPGSTSWRWAMCGRVSLGPFAWRATATASRVSRTARSPMAWTWAWKPSASSRATYCPNASGSMMLRP